MIFKDEWLASFWDDPVSVRHARMPVSVRKVLYRRLQMLEAAHAIQDLAVPPGNRLEKLSGDRAGQYSIRVNRQWRLCFAWRNGEAVEVEFCDYHP